MEILNKARVSRSRTATLLFVLGTLFWGITFVLIKESLDSIDVYSFIFWRFLIAGLLLIPLSAGLKRDSEENLKNPLLPAIATGAVLCGGYLTQTIGLQYTSASKGAFITGLAVVFVPVITAIISRKLPKVPTIISVALATWGLWLLTLSSSLSINIGDVWVFACAVFFACHILVVARFSGKTDPISFTKTQLLTVSVVAGVLALITGSLTFPSSFSVWRSILFCAFFATTFMYFVQSRYQQYISESKTAVIFSLEPFFGALAAYLYTGEEITMKMIAGGILIFAGMLISELKS